MALIGCVLIGVVIGYIYRWGDRVLIEYVDRVC